MLFLMIAEEQKLLKLFVNATGFEICIVVLRRQTCNGNLSGCVRSQNVSKALIQPISELPLDPAISRGSEQKALMGME